MKLPIGGTLAAGILGESPWMSPLKAWSILTEKLPPDQLDHLPHIKRGKYLETAVANWWADEAGRALLPAPGLVADAELPFLAGHPDRIIAPLVELSPGWSVAQHSAGPWEGKTASWIKRRDWEDGKIPGYYLIQVQFYMRVLRMPWGSIGALVGDELLVRHVERDDAFIRAMVDFLARFVAEHVEKDVPPEPQATERDRIVLHRLHPKDTGETIALAHDLRQLAVLRPLWQRRKSEAEGKLLEIDNQLKAAMGTATFATADGVDVSWKYHPRNEPARAARTVDVRTINVKVHGQQEETDE